MAGISVGLLGVEIVTEKDGEELTGTASVISP